MHRPNRRRGPRGQNAFAMLTQAFDGWEGVVSEMVVVDISKCIEALTCTLPHFLPFRLSSPSCPTTPVRRHTRDLRPSLWLWTLERPEVSES
jgi:hypothetical protein